MIAIGFGLAWVGYALGFWGHALVKGWNISFTQIASPTSYYQGAWPPPMATNTVVFPDGSPDDNAGSGTSSTTTSTSTRSRRVPAQGNNAPSGIPPPGVM